MLYHCYGGTHSSVLAAALHTGYLDPYRLPSSRELMTLPLFDKRAGSDFGRACLYGLDDSGHEVWVVGRQRHRSAPQEVFKALATFRRNNTDIFVVDVAHLLNWPMRCGGFLSRAMLMPSLGRPLIVLGTRLIFDSIVRLVAHTKSEVLCLEHRVHP